MQNFAFLGEQVVIDSEAVECFEMAVDDGRCHQFGHSRSFALALFDFLESVCAELETRFIFCEKLRDARVEIPADVIESGRESEDANVINGFLFEMQKPENYIRDLDAGVVDVILNLDVPACVAEETDEGVAQHRVAQVADMRRFVRVDGGVLDDRLGCVGTGGRGFLLGLHKRASKKFCAVEEKIQISGASYFDSGDARNWLQRIRNFLCQRARRLLQALGEFEADRRGGFAHCQFRGPLGGDGHVRLVTLVDMVSQRFPDPVFDNFVHKPPTGALMR